LKVIEVQLGIFATQLNESILATLGMGWGMERWTRKNMDDTLLTPSKLQIKSY